MELHHITTDDGYILGVFRIPSSPFVINPPIKNRQPILLMHALLDSSYAYICQDREHSLGYILADEGYDVWFGNVRGNTWSKNHTRLSVNDQEFWDFSMDDHALFDVPTTVEYVLSQTGFSSLPYVGHSQGTAIAFAGFSSNPELARVRSMCTTPLYI